MDSVKPSNEYWMKVLTEDDAKALELFKQKGLVAVTMPEKEMDQLREMVKPIYQEWIDDMNKRGHKGQELFDLMIKSAQAYKGA
jgi:TRAP-type C4-dicarboxylate transport system substrate-binding protein